MKAVLNDFNGDDANTIVSDSGAFFRPNDDLRLRQTVQLLCQTGVRHSLELERMRIWLKQFDDGPERTLALLILRNLIYRTRPQIESSLTQAVRKAVMHFVADPIREVESWRRLACSEIQGHYFWYGPPSAGTAFAQPGKSGEVIVRALKHSIGIAGSNIMYPSNLPRLDSDDRYLLVDDASFTGHQIRDFIKGAESFPRPWEQVGIVLSIAHADAVSLLESEFNGIRVFYGEKMTHEHSLESLSSSWIAAQRWPYQSITPLEIYEQIVNEKAKFEHHAPLGYGGLGLLVAYEHGVPDDSLQLLWDSSNSWMPLFDR